MIEKESMPTSRNGVSSSKRFAADLSIMFSETNCSNSFLISSCVAFPMCIPVRSTNGENIFFGFDKQSRNMAFGTCKGFGSFQKIIILPGFEMKTED